MLLLQASNGSASGKADTLADRLYRARTAARLSQAALARKAGVDSSFISRIESGKVVEPGIEKLDLVAATLGLDLHDLWPQARRDRLPARPVTQDDVRRLIAEEFAQWLSGTTTHDRPARTEVLLPSDSQAAIIATNPEDWIRVPRYLVSEAAAVLRALSDDPRTPPVDFYPVPPRFLAVPIDAPLKLLLCDGGVCEPFARDGATMIVVPGREWAEGWRVVALVDNELCFRRVRGGQQGPELAPEFGKPPRSLVGVSVLGRVLGKWEPD